MGCNLFKFTTNVIQLEICLVLYKVKSFAVCSHAVNMLNSHVDDDMEPAIHEPDFFPSRFW